MAIDIAELITSLPLILQGIQIFSYIVLTLFFGSIAVKGWRGAPSMLVSILLRLGAGFVCLIAGITFGPWVPWLATDIMRLFQLDMIIMGFVFSIIMAVAIALVSNNLPGSAERMQRIIEKLQKRIKKMQQGEVSGVNSQRIAGAVIVIVVVALSALYFPGFPNMAEDLLSSLAPMGGEGLSQITQMSAECTGIMASLLNIQQTSPELLMMPEVYRNPSLESRVESERADSVLEMYKVEYEGAVIVQILMESGDVCTATETELCLCVERG